MIPVAKRLRVALGALLAIVLAFAVPGPLAFALGMVVVLALPQLIERRIGAASPTGEGTLIITARTKTDDTFRLVRVWSALAWIAYAALALTSSGRDLSTLMAQASFFGFGFTSVALAMFAARLFDGRVRGQSVTLERTTLTVNTAEGPQVVAYDELRRVEVEKKLLWLVTGTDRIGVPVDGGPEVVARLAGQLEAARTREHAVVAATKELHRPGGMGAREWLQRLDALAAAAHGGYRGASLDEEELWRVLGDADADAELRAGAARVLAASGPTARARIAETVVKPEVRARIDLALEPDVDAAADAFEALERADLRRAAGL